MKVRFVEMTDTIPIQGPDTDVHGRRITSDFMALLDPKERQIVFLLNSGWTRQQDIASVLGYSNTQRNIEASEQNTENRRGILHRLRVVRWNRYHVCEIRIERLLQSTLYLLNDAEPLNGYVTRYKKRLKGGDSHQDTLTVR